MGGYLPWSKTYIAMNSIGVGCFKCGCSQLLASRPILCWAVLGWKGFRSPKAGTEVIDHNAGWKTEENFLRVFYEPAIQRNCTWLGLSGV